MDFGIILENVLDFHQQQSSNLKVATEIMKTSLETKSVPDFAKIDPDVQLTMLYTVIAAHAVIVLLIPRLRRFVFGTIESILVLAVLLCLVAVVLGLPFGIMYIAAKGSTFLAASLLRTFPQLQALVNQAQEVVSKVIPAAKS